MTPLERQEYNKKYYEMIKQDILLKACTKIECEFCKRKVIYNNLNKHIETDICKRQQMRITEKQRRLSNI